jgi:serine/threonine protein kinase
MKSIWLVNNSGLRQRITLDPAINSGGAGCIHPVSGNSSYVVKLYHPQTLAIEGNVYAKKIKHMVLKPPTIASSSVDDVQLAWPVGVIEDPRGGFLGFAMPALNVKQTENLQWFIQPKQATQKNLRSDLGARITVAANLAGIVKALHDKGYQVVDLKPPNLQLYRKSLNLAVLDCDGFNVQLPGDPFPAPQVTPDYLAPEFQGKVVTSPLNQDRFALSIIIFQLLNFGIHPYQSKSIITGPKAPTDLEGKIAQGLYAYSKTSNPLIRPLTASAHELFPDDLRNFFDRAFGSLPERRPTASDWFLLLEKFAKPSSGFIKKCSQGHLWFNDHACGECQRKGVIGKRLFKKKTKVKTSKQSFGQGLKRRGQPHTQHHKGYSISTLPKVALLIQSLVSALIVGVDIIKKLLPLILKIRSPYAIIIITLLIVRFMHSSESNLPLISQEVGAGRDKISAPDDITNSPRFNYEESVTAPIAAQGQNEIPSLGTQPRELPSQDPVIDAAPQNAWLSRSGWVGSPNEKLNPKAGPAAPLSGADNKSSCDPSKVYALEKERQYHGDDPIVRERLGLPPVCRPER